MAAELTQILVAKHLDLSQSQVSQMLRDGLLPKLTKAVTLDECRLVYIRRLREQAAGRAGFGGELDLVRERALLARAQRLAIEMRNAMAKGRLLSGEVVEQVFGGVIDAVRAGFLRLPTMMAPQLVNEPNPAVILAKLTAAVLEILTALADARVLEMRGEIAIRSREDAGADDVSDDDQEVSH
jgi:phage terminase Nu1 subunit (DNA packaging protein)